MTRDHFVYWLFGHSGVCLYVGITRNPEQRWGAHRRRFGSEIASKRMAGPYTSGTARRIERQQQDWLQPKYDARQQQLRAKSGELPSIVYTIAEAAAAIGIPEKALREITGRYEFLRLPDDSEWAA